MTLKKVLVMISLIGLLLLGNSLEGASVTYRAHVAGLSWLPWVSDGQTAGTVGQSRRMEAAVITLNSSFSPMTIVYRAHVAGEGWKSWVVDGQTAGTIGQSKRMEALQILLVSPPTCSVPPYAPAYWNNGGTIQYRNNCYNYANNKRTDTFAQPGRASGHMYSSITCLEVKNGSLSDGLTSTTASAIPPQGKTKIALVVALNWDFHWYRKDNNGYWSHKPGGTMATNRDNSGNVITNPETANRGSYTIFCGYFLTCSNVSQGQGHANIQ